MINSKANRSKMLSKPGKPIFDKRNKELKLNDRIVYSVNGYSGGSSSVNVGIVVGFTKENNVYLIQEIYYDQYLNDIDFNCTIECKLLKSIGTYRFDCNFVIIESKEEIKPETF